MAKRKTPSPKERKKTSKKKEKKEKPKKEKKTSKVAAKDAAKPMPAKHGTVPEEELEEEAAVGNDNDNLAVYCDDCEMWLSGPTQLENHKIRKKHQTNTKNQVAPVRCWGCRALEAPQPQQNENEEELDDTSVSEDDVGGGEEAVASAAAKAPQVEWLEWCLLVAFGRVP